MRLGLGLPRKRQLGDKLVIGTTRAGGAGLGLQRMAPGRGALGEARQRVGEAFALALDVKHVAMARRVAPGGPLPGAQTLPGIGDRIVGIEPCSVASSRCTPQVSALRWCSAASR